MEKSGFLSTSSGTVSGVFFKKEDVDRVYYNLLHRGHTSDDISVLMSDETLNKYQNPTDENTEEIVEEESALSRAANTFSGFFIAISSMISLPGLGISISKTLQKRMPDSDIEGHSYEKSHPMRSSGIPDEHLDSYDNGMQEGGIIISLDPKNETEKRAIIKDFRENNGHDILGDDGYTELD